MTETPITPYPERERGGATSGWSGSETSRERAIRRDGDGRTVQLQHRVLHFVADRGDVGATIAEVRAAFRDQHHGSLSGALTTLHKAGRVARLTDRRDRCAIYVTPTFVLGRETAQAGRRPSDTRADVWDECAREAYDLGWLHDAALVDIITRNPYRT